MANISFLFLFFCTAKIFLIYLSRINKNPGKGPNSKLAAAFETLSDNGKNQQKSIKNQLFFGLKELDFPENSRSF